MKRPENPTNAMCLATGLTDGVQCELMRRLGKKCKKPSKAIQAFGEHTTKDGLVTSRFWHCEPALLFKAHHGTDGIPNFDEMVKLQMECDSFMTRK